MLLLNMYPLPWCIDPLTYSMLTPLPVDYHPPLVLSSELSNIVILLGNIAPSNATLNHVISNISDLHGKLLGDPSTPFQSCFWNFIILVSILSNHFFIICFYMIYCCWFVYPCCDFSGVSCPINNRTFLLLTDKYVFFCAAYIPVYVSSVTINSFIP